MSIIAIGLAVLVMIVTIVGIVALSIFLPGDNTGVITQIVGFAGIGTVALFGLVKSNQNNAKLIETHEDTIASKQSAERAVSIAARTDEKVTRLAIDVDGRLSRLLEVTGKAEHAAGVAAGEQAERDRTAATAGLTPAGGTPIPPDGPRAQPGDQC